MKPLAWLKTIWPAFSLVVFSAAILLSLPIFVSRVLDCFEHPEQQNTTDMAIFAGAGKRFLSTGQLYERSNNYAQTYAPGAGVYKFPPAYQLSILPLLKICPDEFTFLLAERLIQLAMYLTAITLIILAVGKNFFWHEHSPLHTSCRFQSFHFVLISILISLWSIGFFECFVGIEPEILIFFLLSLAFYFAAEKSFLSGMMLSFAAAIKIYPLLIMIYFIFRKDKQAIAGFSIGFIAISIASIFFIGIDESIFYVKHILPVLLVEKPIYHVQNTTIEAMLEFENIIKGMPGNITAIVKLMTLVLIGINGYWLHSRLADKQCILIFIGMLISAILLTISNYWPQYQIILIVPLLCALAYSIQTHSNFTYLITIIIAISLGIQEIWLENVIRSILAHRMESHLQQITAMMNEYPSIIPYLIYFPDLWVLNRMRDIMYLSPALLFLISFAIMIRLPVEK